MTLMVIKRINDIVFFYGGYVYTTIAYNCDMRTLQFSFHAN